MLATWISHVFSGENKGNQMVDFEATLALLKILVGF